MPWFVNMPLCQLQFCTNQWSHRSKEILLSFKELYNTFHSPYVFLSLLQSKIVMLMVHSGQRPFVDLFWSVTFKTGTLLFKSILSFWDSPLNAWWVWWYPVKDWTWGSCRSFSTLMNLWFCDFMVSFNLPRGLTLAFNKGALHLLDFSTIETCPL